MAIANFQINGPAIDFPPLIPGRLLKRYKRFLADVALENGDVVTAHCPNTGSMKGCAETGATVYLSVHESTKRKYKHSWELIQTPTSLVGINTLLPNKLVKKSIIAGYIPTLKSYTTVRSEVPIGQSSRIDLLLEQDQKPPCYIEIKNCTLVENQIAQFPDAVTQRGRKHIDELSHLRSLGNRCVIFFFIQRMDALKFYPADHIDPAFGDALRKAVGIGVEIMVYDVHIDLNRVRLNHPIPFYL